MIHVIGNAAIDTILRVAQLPRPGETLVAEGVVEDLGGKGFNQAIVIARCGAPVGLVAAIGEDDQGARLRAALTAEGVSTDRLKAGAEPTDRCLITVDAEGENTIVSSIEAARAFNPVATQALADAMGPGDFALMQGNLTPLATRAVLELAKRRGATTVLNPSPTFPADAYDWRLVDLAIVNRGEAIELGRSSDPLSAAHALCEAGVGAVALTLGGEGAALLAEGRVFRAPAPRVAAVDTVGAGDVFCGALVAARACGWTYAGALPFAVAAASIAVTRRGVLTSFPSRAELRAIWPSAEAQEPRS